MKGLVCIMAYEDYIKAQKMAGRFLDQLHVDQLQLHFIGDFLCNSRCFLDRHRLPRQANPSKSVRPCKNTPPLAGGCLNLRLSPQTPRPRNSNRLHDFQTPCNHKTIVIMP